MTPGRATDARSGTEVVRARTSLRSFIGVYLLTGALAIGIWVAAVTLNVSAPPALLVLAGLVPPLAGVAYAWLVHISTEYRIYADSLEVESGIVARRIENVQLFRVRDLGLSQSLTARLLGIGDVIIRSTDPSAPVLTLRGVQNPRQLYETLRDLIARSQATRRTMIVEEDGPGPARDL